MDVRALTDFSTLRLFGVTVGFAILLFGFLYFRSERWSRGAFTLCALVSAGMIMVAVFPDSLNFVRNVLDLAEVGYGRVLVLLILSNILLLLLCVYNKAKVDKLKYLVDRSLRFAAVDNVMPQNEFETRRKDVMVIIPALNEADNLKTLLPRIPKQVCGQEVGVIVIDDGSTDGTREVALANGCLVARTSVNRGQGAASRIGYAFLARHKVTIGVTMDADNQHDPNDLEKLVTPIMRGELDLVIGSRVLGSADRTTAARRIGISVYARLISLVMGQRITDSSSGYKGFRMSRMAEIDLREDQFQSSEVLIAAAKKGLRIGEVPIRITQREFGESRKGTNFVYGALYLRTVAKSWWR